MAADLCIIGLSNNNGAAEDFDESPSPVRKRAGMLIDPKCITVLLYCLTDVRVCLVCSFAASHSPTVRVCTLLSKEFALELIARRY